MTYGTARRLADRLQQAQARHPNTILLVHTRLEGGLPASHGYQVEVTIHGAKVIFTGGYDTELGKFCSIMQEIHP